GVESLDVSDDSLAEVLVEDLDSPVATVRRASPRPLVFEHVVAELHEAVLDEDVGVELLEWLGHLLDPTLHPVHERVDVLECLADALPPELVDEPTTPAVESPDGSPERPDASGVLPDGE